MLTFTSFLAVICCIFANDTLLQVHVLHRHGDRAPLRVLPNNPIDWATIDTAPEQLTGQGVAQARNLGRFLHNRYMVENQFLNPLFVASEVFVRSTRVDRTIMTANLALSELFINATRYVDVDRTVLGGRAMVPVNTENKMNYWLQAVDLCAKFNDEIQPALFQSKAWLAKENEVKEWIAEFKEATGFQNPNLPKFYDFYDPVFVQYVHGFLAPPLKKYVNKSIELASWSETQKKNAGGVLIGGPILYSMFAEMQALFDTNSPSTRKYLQYSAHDSTLMAFSAAIENDKEAYFQVIPNYASAYILELWRNEVANDIRVHAFYRDGVTGDQVPLTGFPKTYAQFQDFVNKRGISVDEWCMQCSDAWPVFTSPDECIRRVLHKLEDEGGSKPHYRTLTIVFASFFALAVVAGIAISCFARKTFLKNQRERLLATTTSHGLEQ